MREIVIIQRETLLRNGTAVLWERKCHGLMKEDGSFRLLAYCGKRIPLSKVAAALSTNTAEEKKGAA